jgi:hypothetical protein
LKSSTPHTLLIRDKEEEEEEEERTGGRREVLTLYRITYSRTHTRKRRGQTLESFLLANDYEFVHEILIMEDSGDAAMCRTLRVLYEGQMGVDRPSIRILCNQQRLGQMRTLDRVWAHVTTPWHKFPKVL